MEAALNNFHLMKADGKMCILGDMGELGEASMEEHQKVVDLLKKYDFERVWLVGKEFAKTEHSADYELFQNVEAVKQRIATDKPQGHTILIKGSNSTKLYQIPELL